MFQTVSLGPGKVCGQVIANIIALCNSALYYPSRCIGGVAFVCFLRYICLTFNEARGLSLNSTNKSCLEEFAG